MSAALFFVANIVAVAGVCFVLELIAAFGRGVYLGLKHGPEGAMRILRHGLDDTAREREGRHL